MSEEPIMSIKEFRKISGFTSDEMDDSTILDAINRLDLMARIYVNQVKERTGDSDAG